MVEGAAATKNPVEAPGARKKKRRVTVPDSVASVVIDADTLAAECVTLETTAFVPLVTLAASSGGQNVRIRLVVRKAA
jgi:hypothetical protein